MIKVDIELRGTISGELVAKLQDFVCDLRSAGVEMQVWVVADDQSFELHIGCDQEEK